MKPKAPKSARRKTPSTAAVSTGDLSTTGDEVPPLPTAHILLRVRSGDGRTISSHHEILEDQGQVLFAKMGKEIGGKLLEQLSSQLRSHTPTFLYIATAGGWNVPFDLYQCELSNILTQVTKAQLRLVPEYLHASAPEVGTWFQLRTINRASSGEINKLFILTSGRCVTGALRGMNSVFRVGVTGQAPVKEVPELFPATASDRKRSASRFDDDYVNNLEDDEIQQILETYRR